MPANKSILCSVCQLGTKSVFLNVEMVLNDAITLNELDSMRIPVARSINPAAISNIIISRAIEPVFAKKLWASTKHHA